jgi:hypothetical protein
MQFGKIWQGRAASLSGLPLSASNNDPSQTFDAQISRTSSGQSAYNATHFGVGPAGGWRFSISAITAPTFFARDKCFIWLRFLCLS